MKTFLTLLGREVKSFFYSPIAYVVLFFFLLLSGVNFYFQIRMMNGIPIEITVVQAFFSTAIFWFPFVLSFPLITMRSYSEEFRMGTFETLTTAPVRDTQVVLAKFCGVLIFYCILWSPTLCSFAAFQYITGKAAVAAAGAYAGTYLLLFLIGCFYSAVGCLSSSFTKDQIIAATIAFTVTTILLLTGFIPEIFDITAPAIKDLFSYISAVQHMQDFSKGIIDSRNIVWYLSMTALTMFFTLQVFQARKWNEGKGIFAVVLVIAGLVAGIASYWLLRQVNTNEKLAIAIAAALGVACISLGYALLLGSAGRQWQIGLNTLVQLCIVTGIVVMLNYLSFRHFQRWDYSRDRKFAISSQTTNLLSHLKKPVRAVIFFSGAGEIVPDLQALMREYEFASKKKFTAEFIDSYRSLSRAQELQTKYKFGVNESIVILDYDGRSKFVKAEDMADVEMPDQMSMMMGQTQPRIKAFKGEQAITSALLELTEGRTNKVYFTGGHGEPDISSPDLKMFAEDIKRQNIQFATLNLLNVTAIPDDARSLIVCGPKYDFSEIEMKLLESYWGKKGRVLMLLNPFARTPRLSAWLSEQGVVPQEDRVIGLGNFLGVDENGNPKVTKGTIKDAGFVVLNSRTKMTKYLEGTSKRLLGTTQSLQIDRVAEKTAKLRIMPLLESVEGFWGETDLTADDEQVFFDPKKDNAGPLHLALAVERGGVADDRVKIETSRLVVIGNAEVLGLGARRLSEGIAGDLTVNALNWLLDREELIGIPAKEKKTVTFSLDERQMGSLAAAVMLILPGIVAVFGLLTWWLRRS